MRSRRVTAITFKLEFAEGLSIVEPLREDLEQRIDPDRHTTIPVASGPDGSPIVMGTSVVGPLRTHLHRYVVQPEVELWFKTISPWDPGAKATWTRRAATLADLLCGSEPDEIKPKKLPPAGDDTPAEADPKRALRPSALRVLYVKVGDTVRGTTARTAINRRSGVGEAGKLFQRDHLETAEVDVVVAVDLSILDAVIQDVRTDSATTVPTSANLVNDLVVALSGWKPNVGGLGGVGFGKAELTALKHGTKDPIDPVTLFSASSTVELYRGLAQSETVGKLATSVKQDNGDPWCLPLTFTATDPLYVSPKAEEGRDARANVRVTASTVLGSSWRGVLRSRCEFILRSVGVKACETTVETCGECPTCRLFGWSAPAATAGKPPGHVGLLRFSQSEIKFSQPEIKGSEIEEIPHVAIDRFSGGAADEKLYFHKAYLPGATVELKIEQKDERRPVPVWGRQLLALAIRDLSDGLIGLGSATTRGYGTLTTSKSLVDLLPRDGWVDSLIKEHPEYAEKEVLA
ncbi:MAG: RAMP superfamily CRISPR-associated protein [Tessaracoccus sp.]